MIVVRQLPVIISIHASREGGDRARLSTPPSLIISIHASREGGDDFQRGAADRDPISIHASREGGDFRRFFSATLPMIFQSTPPVREATTTSWLPIEMIWGFQSTPPVREATAAAGDRWEAEEFQSTPPVREATPFPAGRGGGNGRRDFNPRLP